MSEAMDAPVKAKKSDSLKMYKLTIHSGEGDGDKGDVFLGHNYAAILIQRDKEVIVNEHYINVLKDTVIETVVRDGEGKDRHIKIPTYSYSVEPA